MTKAIKLVGFGRASQLVLLAFEQFQQLQSAVDIAHSQTLRQIQLGRLEDAAIGIASILMIETIFGYAHRRLYGTEMPQ